ncbi:MAG TPA: TolC family protein, partial [Candidatus Acidoferrales bacterium]
MKVSICAVAFVLIFTGPAAAQQRPPDVPVSVPVSVEELVAEALRVHPEIQAASRLVDARRARVPQARALPDPEFSIGYMGDLAPFKVQRGDPSSYRQLGVMQEIPYPGKLALRGQIAGKDVDAERWGVEVARRRIAAEVRVAYFELWAVRKSAEVTTRSKDLLEKLARITEERYKVGQGLQQDVLRGQTEVSRVIQRLALFTQRERTLVAQLNSLLQRPHDTPIPSLAPVEKAALAYSLDELLARAAADSPDIRRTQERIEQNQLAVRLAERDYYPDFRIGWDYQNRPGMPEMYGLRFSVNIPVFYKSKQREAVNEAA